VEQDLTRKKPANDFLAEVVTAVAQVGEEH
jgi:hypothetical protein